jgi:hypothetical protein
MTAGRNRRPALVRETRRRANNRTAMSPHIDNCHPNNF